MSDFSFELSAADRQYLRELVLWSLDYYFANGANPPAREVPMPPPASCLNQELGAFVTFKMNGQLRGCIGQIIGHGPLYQAIAQMAQAAAFADPRFSPLQKDEVERVEFEISIMGPIEPCPDTAKIKIGKHGLVIQQGRQRGLLLPQVAQEYGWDVPEFLDSVCRKAGLVSGAWKNPDTKLFWFECAVVQP